MRLGEYYGALSLTRKDKALIAKFLKPHMTISTCWASGGLSTDYTHIFNHQACEPAGDHRAIPQKAFNDPLLFRRIIAKGLDLIPEECATLTTAANMNNAAIIEESFRNQIVVAVVTAGVEKNAGKAGDPAAVFEINGSYEKLGPSTPPSHGTINIMLFMNRELTKGALVRSIITATEAKTAALLELCVGSNYSDGLATGTGTDQIASSCLLNTGTPLEGAGKHSKLGELIGVAVKKAVKKALAMQNHLTPNDLCAAHLHLKRFGADKKKMQKGIANYLPAEKKNLFIHNFDGLDLDPPTVAMVCALCHSKDKFTYGILPESCRPEIMGTQAAVLCLTVSGKKGSIYQYIEALSPLPQDNDNHSFLEMTYKAMALGFTEKWDFYLDFK
jgi:adenosylcobinamide amidohydrolase